MAKIPLPERGQPLDLSYMYEIAKTVNSLAEDISPSNHSYVSIDTLKSGRQIARASEVRIIGGYKEVFGGTVLAGNEKSFTYEFGLDFKFSPIVIATPVNINATAAGKNVSVILDMPTTTNVSGTIKFGSNGDAAVGMNLLIIGIPEN
jgi:hypothetical protein